MASPWLMCAGPAVHNLARAARLDDKTILRNGMALGEDAAQIGSDPARPDVIVFGDFKQINDQYGHPAGDAALRHAGDLVDILFRPRRCRRSRSSSRSGAPGH